MSDVKRHLGVVTIELPIDQARAVFVAEADYDAKCAEVERLRKAATKLADECEAEFTTDGYWNADDALVSRKTVQDVRAALAQPDMAEYLRPCPRCGQRMSSSIHKASACAALAGDKP
jgi:hypothetical protein